VDYQLTKLGRFLRCAVEPLGAWARAHVADIHKAREKFGSKKRRARDRDPGRALWWDCCASFGLADARL
jgi:hypothetical protein